MNKNNTIFSIQSRVSSGYVGLNIADFIIQLHGIDIVSVPTVLYSTHTDNGPIYGKVVPTTVIKELLDGISTLKIKSEIEYIVSGYLAAPSQVKPLRDFIKNMQEEQVCTYICDPVMGDFRTNGLYIDKKAADNIIKYLIPIADIITPNHFELEYILGHSFNSPETLLELIKSNSLLYNKVIIGTSINFSKASAKEVVVITNGNIKRFPYNEIEVDIVGTGDLFTAIIASQLTMGVELENAISVASNFISSILSYLNATNQKEMTAKSIIKFNNLIK